MSLEEVRVVDPNTGGEKGSKLARFSLIPTEFLWEMACHYGRGARKYADRNWERGYNWSLSVDALERHLAQWKLGEERDFETGTHHLVAVAWHACALFIFNLRGLGKDDVRVAKYNAAYTSPLVERTGPSGYAPYERSISGSQTLIPPPNVCKTEGKTT